MNLKDPNTLTNLADASLGAAALVASDEFFAAKERMLQRAEPVFKPGTYDEHGQWMDGWETRRRRGEGHDSCVVRLAYPGVIEVIDIDTRFFTGNYAPEASVDATRSRDPMDPETEWTEILPASKLAGDSHNLFDIDSREEWSNVRLNIFPDGGVARFKVYGTVQPDWDAIRNEEFIDLAAVEHGGVALYANDQHYGSIQNLNRPGRGVNMGDGWETRRRREPGFDWVLIKLGMPGVIREIEVDTAHFRGNYPDRVSVNAALVPGPTDRSLFAACMHWPALLPERPLEADTVHRFTDEIAALGTLTHVRVNIHPDGGLSRVRFIGSPKNIG